MTRNEMRWWGAMVLGLVTALVLLCCAAAVGAGNAALADSQSLSSFTRR